LTAPSRERIPTVREEIAFGPLQLGLSRKDTTGRVEDVTAMLGIADLLDRTSYQLSGSQKKVAMATVLVRDTRSLPRELPSRHWLTGTGIYFWV
jgi:cobalt/nickel transport system ATP-binding protein